MQPKPSVTVVVPTYNRPEYLGTALESAFAQTYRDFELVVVDDAGTKDVTPVLNRFQDDRLVFIRRERNLGMAANIWRAMASARTKYVSLLQDDDAWEPGFLEATVRALENNPAASMAFTDHWVIGPDNTIDTSTTEMSTRRFHRDTLAPGLQTCGLKLAVEWNAIPVAMASLVRTSAISWEEEPGEIGTNWDRWLGYLATRSAPVYYDSRRLTRYRVHPASETADMSHSAPGRLRLARQTEALYRRILSDPSGAGIHAHVGSQYHRALARASLLLAACGHRAEARCMVFAGARNVSAAWCIGLRCAIELPPFAISVALGALDRVRRPSR